MCHTSVSIQLLLPKRLQNPLEVTSVFCSYSLNWWIVSSSAFFPKCGGGIKGYREPLEHGCFSIQLLLPKKVTKPTRSDISFIWFKRLFNLLFVSSSDVLKETLYREPLEHGCFSIQLLLPKRSQNPLEVTFLFWRTLVLAIPFPLANKKTDYLPSKAFPIPGMRKGSVAVFWCSVWKIAAALAKTSGCWSATFLDSVGSFFKSYSSNVGPLDRHTPEIPKAGIRVFVSWGFTALKGVKQRQ